MYAPWAWIAWASVAGAHHDIAVQQVGSTAVQSPGGMLEIGRPRVEASLGFTWRTFGQLRRGFAPHSGVDPGVGVLLWTPGLAVELASRTRLELVQPFGIMVPDSRGFGLGDLRLAAAQELGPLRIGVIGLAPTGRYSRDAVVSVLDATGTADGTIELTAYDARASLGAGTWRAGAEVAVHLTSDSVRGALAASLVQPLGASPDGIRWGRDVTATGLLELRELADLLSLGAGLDLRLHTADRVLPVEAGDDTSPLEVGRRVDAGVLGSLGLKLAPAAACGARARVPVVRWMQGVQLAETVVTSVQCTFGWARSGAEGDR